MIGTRRSVTFAVSSLIMVVVAVSSPVTQADAAVRPGHVVACDVAALAPQQFSPGSPVTGTAHIVCLPTPPDASNTTVILWRYDGGGKNSKIAHTTSNTTGTDWWLNTTTYCSSSRAYPMHTQVLTDFYHGNWAHDSANSQTVTMYC